MRIRFAILLTAMLACGAAAAQVPVRVAAASSSALQSTIEVTGTTTSPRSATLSTAVAGMVALLDVDAGRHVAAGDTLLELDAELVELAVQRLQAQVRQRDVALADARRRFEEAERVGPDKGIAQTTIESLRAAVAIEQAALAAARAALKEQRALMDRHRVTAPFPGVISVRHTELGEWVRPGDPVLELVALDSVRFDFRVAQDYSGDIDLGTSVTLRASSGRELAGRVSAIVPVKDPQSRTFLVRVTTQDDPDGLTPGMSVTGRFALSPDRVGVTVTRDAVLRFPDGRITVWVVEGLGEAPLVRERRVTTGLEFDGRVEVVQGLAAGELVVTRGNETLTDGQSVVILDSAT